MADSPLDKLKNSFFGNMKGMMQVNPSPDSFFGNLEGIIQPDRPEDLSKSNPELIEEMKRYFQPKSELVKALPDRKTVRDMTEVILKDANGNYVMYKMIEGNWVPFVQVDSGGA